LNDVIWISLGAVVGANLRFAVSRSPDRTPGVEVSLASVTRQRRPNQSGSRSPEQQAAIRLTPTVRAAITLGSAIVAALAWSAARLALPDRFAGLGSLCAAWIALYPAARFYAGGPAWGHWAGGAMVIIAWLLTLWFR
jgi:hypothetical protein